jgi:hypothetical protein
VLNLPEHLLTVWTSVRQSLGGPFPFQPLWNVRRHVVYPIVCHVTRVSEHVHKNIFLPATGDLLAESVAHPLPTLTLCGPVQHQG